MVKLGVHVVCTRMMGGGYTIKMGKKSVDYLSVADKTCYDYNAPTDN